MIDTFPLNDVRIAVVDTLDPIGPPVFSDDFAQVTSERFDFIVPEIATFSVRNGCEILILAHPETTNDILHLYLNGTVLAVILLQRGIFCLHASSVVVHNQAFVFAGNSGSGKSSLAYQFLRANYTCLNDDVTPIYNTNECIETRSITNHIKVDDTLIGEGTSHLSRVPSQAHKVFLPLPNETNNFRVKRLYVLAWGPTFSIEEIQGAEKLNVLLQYIFRNEYLDAFPESRISFFKEFVHFIQETEIFRIYRSQTETVSDNFEHIVSHVLNHESDLEQ